VASLSYDEALERFQSLMVGCTNHGIRVRSHQIFHLIRTNGSGATASWVRLKSVSAFLAHMVLALVSMVSLIRLRLSCHDCSGHFQVDLLATTGIDYRSAAIDNLLAPSRTAVFFHSGTLWGSVKSLRRKEAPVYIESLVALVLVFLRPLHRFQASSLARKSGLPEFMHREGLQGALSVAVAEQVFRYVRLRRLLMIDDPRNVAVLCLAARRQGIRTVGYMHGKFNRFHVGLLVEPFDYYLVWNGYFAGKIQELWGGQYPGQIGIVGLIRADAAGWAAKRLPPRPCVLWLDEDLISFSQVAPYLKAMAVAQDLSVIVRLKPGRRPEAALMEMGCQLDTATSFYESVVTHRAMAVVGSHSTALLEAHLFGAVPVSIRTGLGYGEELVADRLVHACDSPDELLGLLNGLLDGHPEHKEQVQLSPLAQLAPFNPGFVSSILAQEGFSLV